MGVDAPTSGEPVTPAAGGLAVGGAAGGAESVRLAATASVDWPAGEPGAATADASALVAAGTLVDGSVADVEVPVGGLVVGGLVVGGPVDDGFVVGGPVDDGLVDDGLVDGGLVDDETLAWLALEPVWSVDGLEPEPVTCDELVVFGLLAGARLPVLDAAALDAIVVVQRPAAGFASDGQRTCTDEATVVTDGITVSIRPCSRL